MSLKKNNLENETKAKKEYRNIGSMWESKQYEGQHNIKFDDFSGDLLFQDKKTNTIYKVKAASLFAPRPGANGVPPGLVYNLVVDLTSSYQTQAKMEIDQDDET
jgi:hypothetical protein